MNKRQTKKYIKKTSSKTIRRTGMSISLIHQTGKNYDETGIPHYIEKRKTPIVRVIDPKTERYEKNKKVK